MMNSKRTAKWLGAAAVAAIIAGGAVETGFVAPNTAHAELRSLQQPIAMPSFADVIDRVKPAVVSVRVKVQQVAQRDDDEDGPNFSMPNVPPGSPLERFFREFRGEPGQRPPGSPRQAQGS